MNEIERRHYDIDPIEFGKLSQAVQNLTKQIDQATERFIESEAILTKRLDAIEAKFSTGKGVAIGLLFAAGGLGAGLSELIGRVWK